MAHVSVDTLYFSIDGDFQPGFEDLVNEFRDQAETDGRPAVTPFEFEGVPVLCRHHGWYSFGYWLTTEAFDLMVSKSEVLPACFVQLRQLYLYEVGDPLEAYRRVRDWLKTWVLADVAKAAVNRIDLCADVVGFPVNVLSPAFFSCRAREMEQKWSQGESSGINWGVRGNAVYCRLYNKVLEAVIHRKTWMDRLWMGPHIDPPWDPGEKETVHDKDTGEVKKNKDGSDRVRWKRKPEAVFRLEFECRRELLDRFAIDTVHRALKDPEDVINNAGHLWEYLTGSWALDKSRHKTFTGWLVLREPGEGTNKTRWNPPTWWQEMAAGGLRPAKTGKIYRREQNHHDVDKLNRQAAGCLSQVAAIMGDTSMEEALKAFEREWAALLYEKGTSFAKVVAHKASGRPVHRTPLEKPAPAGTDKHAKGEDLNVGHDEQTSGAERALTAS